MKITENNSEGLTPKGVIPENDDYGTLTPSDHHQPFPDHQRGRHDHPKVQHLVVQL
jgi:hypothetical protein